MVRGLALRLVGLALVTAACGSPAATSSPMPGVPTGPVPTVAPSDHGSPVASGTPSAVPTGALPTGTPGTVSDVMADASPINVTVTPDEARAARAVIGPEGGTITASDAAGVVYTLTLPEGSVANTTGVTLTPLVSIDGLPFGTPATAAVLIGPDGLQLETLATLAIEGAQAGGQAFTFHGTGSDLARWVHAEDDGQALPVVGFAGFGLVADATGPAAWRPGDPATRFVHDQAAAFYATGTSRSLALLGPRVAVGPVQNSEQVVETVRQASLKRYERAVAAVEQAKADPLGAGELVIQEMLAALHVLHSIGFEEDAQLDLGLVAQILTAMASELSRRCETRSHDPVGTLTRAIRVVRWAQLLGISGPDYAGILTALSGVRGCTQFQIFVDATVALSVTFHEYVEDGDTFDVDGTVVTGRQQLPLQPAGAGRPLRWQAALPLQIRSEAWDHDCWTQGPFQLRGDISGGPATLDASVEPELGYKRLVQFNGSVEVADESSRLIGVVYIRGYALMPGFDNPDCDGLNPLLWDIGGSFFGAGGTTPFVVPVAGGQHRQESEGRTFITPPGTTERFEDAHHAELDATYIFSTDTNGPGFDFQTIFGV